MRKLASIEIITEIRKHDNADKLEIARILGWDVVVNKDQFKTGDHVVYFYIDAFLPQIPEFEFLRKTSFKKNYDGSEGFRLKTIRLRGQISQGLALPLNILNVCGNVGDDVSEMLGVKKYERPIPESLASLTKGDFPGFLRKTDEERIQNLSGQLDYLSEKVWELTEKLDGTSGTYYFNNGEFGVCSRNLELKESETSVYWKMATKYQLKEKLSQLNSNLAIQGEIVGPGIQGNHYLLLEAKLFVFNVYNIDEGRYYGHRERVKFCKELKLDHVPILGSCIDAIEVERCLQEADGPSMLCKERAREGVVYKSSCGKTSFKAISNSFLLAEK